MLCQQQWKTTHWWTSSEGVTGETKYSEKIHLQYTEKEELYNRM